MQKISPSEAIQRLSNGTNRIKGINSTPIEFVRAMGVDDDALYLCRRKQEAFVLPCLDTLDPCLGESDEADLTIDLPPTLTEHLDGYAREIEWYTNIGYKFDGLVEEAKTEVAEVGDVPYLIKTKWGQGAPFNQNLTFDDKDCKVGCVPLAVAMVVFYWYTKGFTRGCLATKAYTTETNKYKVSALSPVTAFDFANMTLKKPTTDIAKKAVADFLEHIGKLVQADYTPSGTGAYTSKTAVLMQTALRLGDNIRIIKASKLGLTAFCDQVLKELSQGRPVMVGGYNSTKTSGHQFICDGYRADDDKFHINWGWGYYDGYYRMGALTPHSSKNFSYYKDAVIGVQPTYKDGDANKDGVMDISDVLTAVDNAIKGTYLASADPNYDGVVDNTDIQIMVNKILGK